MKKNGKESASVLMITSYEASQKGNFIESLEKLAEKYSGEIYYLFTVNNKTAWMEGMNNAFFFKAPYGVIKLAREIIKKVKQNNIKIIHLHFETIAHIAAAKLASLATGVKVVYHNHSFFGDNNAPAGAVKRIKHLIKKSILKILYSGTYQIAISEDSKTNLINRGVYNKDKILRLDNGIVFDRLDKKDKIPNSLMQKKNTALIFFIMGYDVNRKGVDLALTALEKLSRERELVLIIPTSSEKPYISKYSFSQIVAPTNNVATYYEFSDCFLSPSRVEPFGYAPVEAAYCRCPVIASNCPGQRNVTFPGKIEFENGNAEDLYEKIKEFLSISPEEKRKTAEKAREYVIKTYGIDKWTSGMIDIYKQILA